MKPGTRSLSGKLTVPLAIGVVLTCAAMMAILTILLVKRENAQLITRAETSSRLMIEALTFAMSSGISDVSPIEASLKGYGDIIEFRLTPLAGMSSVQHGEPDAVDRSVFAKGKEEVAFLEDAKTGPYLRVTGPIEAKEGCLACHAGIKAGQVVAVTTMYLSTENSRKFIGSFALEAAALTLGMTLVLIGIVWFVLRLVAILPLRRMRDLIGDIAHGQGDLTRRVAIQSKDEIGEVAGLVNSFVDQTHDVVLGIRSFSVTNAGTIEALGKAAERTRESVAATAASIESTKRQIADMAGQNAAVAASAKGILAGITALSGQIENQSEAVAQSSSGISEMSASIESVSRVTDRRLETANDLLVVTRRGGDKVGEVNAEIADISKSVSDIGAAIKLINGIAAQTSLLSMNAAIEAAHAGAYGQGFAVVAEEIRHLAESSAGNAKQVTAVLKQIISKISRALEASNESRESLDRIGTGVTELVQAFNDIAGSTRELAEGGKEILEASESLMGVTKEIRSGSVEMSHGTERIDAAHGEIARLSAISNDSMGEIARRAGEMDADIAAIAALSAKARTVGQQLRDAVGRFKVDEARARPE
jgi:methyl-accepting chemotaxis protein